MKVIRLNRLDSECAGGTGYYYKLKNNKGVKVYHTSSFSNLKDLWQSNDYQNALHEADRLKQASRSGMAPKFYGIVAVKQSDRFRVGILMEHIAGHHPDENTYEEGEAIESLHLSLERVGIYHDDLWHGNIIVKRVRGRKAFYAIDFG